MAAVEPGSIEPILTSDVGDRLAKSIPERSNMTCFKKYLNPALNKCMADLNLQNKALSLNMRAADVGLQSDLSSSMPLKERVLVTNEHIVTNKQTVTAAMKLASCPRKRQMAKGVVYFSSGDTPTKRAGIRIELKNTPLNVDVTVNEHDENGFECSDATSLDGVTKTCNADVANLTLEMPVSDHTHSETFSSSNLLQILEPLLLDEAKALSEWKKKSTVT